MLQFSLAKVLEILPQIIQYIPVTFQVLLATMLFGTLIGLLLASWQLGSNKILRGLARAYIFVLRCTPPIVLLFLVYYGVPALLMAVIDININDTDTAVFVIIALTLLFGATSAECFRAAYLAIPAGQTEAGLALGLTGWQTLYRIVLPQALVVALPNYTNNLADILKDGALAYSIGLVDIMGGANLIIGRNMGNFALETYTAAMLVYLVLVFIIEAIFRLVTKAVSLSEKRLAKDLVEIGRELEWT